MGHPEITFITGNANKAAYLAEHLGTPIAHAKLDLPEIQSLDIAEVVQAKARAAFAAVGGTVLVEDSSLSCAALEGLPGTFVKWFEQTVGLDGICRMLEPYPSRAAEATSAFCLYDGTDALVFLGTIEGHISEHPRGESGFGWDVIFMPLGSEHTWGEMGPEGKHADNMRRRALEKLKAHLAGE